jgi:hypothetical protein
MGKADSNLTGSAFSKEMGSVHLLGLNMLKSRMTVKNYRTPPAFNRKPPKNLNKTDDLGLGISVTSHNLKLVKKLIPPDVSVCMKQVF